jgi:hypothetical protein
LVANPEVLSERIVSDMSIHRFKIVKTTVPALAVTADVEAGSFPSWGSFRTWQAESSLARYPRFDPVLSSL